MVDLYFDLMIFICEKADSHKYVDPKSAVKFSAVCLRLGYFSFCIRFQNWTFMSGVALDLSSMSFFSVRISFSTAQLSRLKSNATLDVIQSTSTFSPNGKQR